jgi:hypothetical protein
MFAAASKFIVAAIACFGLLTGGASAADCRWFARNAKLAIGGHMAALQRIEHEASDRMKGRDTRPFAVLRDEAKKLLAIVADPAALAAEDDLKRCRNRTSPIRNICADAARMLVDALDKQATDPKAMPEKAQYSGAIGECEWLLGAKPLKSGLRGNE